MSFNDLFNKSDFNTYSMKTGSKVKDVHMHQDDALYWLILNAENIKTLHQKTPLTSEETASQEDSSYFINENFLQHYYALFESDLTEAKQLSLRLIKSHTNQILIIFGVVTFLLTVICVALLLVYRTIYIRLAYSSAMFGLLSHQQIKMLIDAASTYLSTCFEKQLPTDQICEEDYGDLKHQDLESWEVGGQPENKREEVFLQRNQAEGANRIIKMSTKESLQKKASREKLRQVSLEKREAVGSEKYICMDTKKPGLSSEQSSRQQPGISREPTKSPNRPTKFSRLNSNQKPQTDSEWAARVESQEERVKKIYSGTKNHYPGYFKRLALSLLISTPLQLCIVLLDFRISGAYQMVEQFLSLNSELRSSCNYLGAIFLEYLSEGAGFRFPSLQQEAPDAMEYFLSKQQRAVAALSLFDTGSLPVSVEGFARSYKSLAHENVCRNEIVAPVFSSIAQSSAS